MENSYISRTSGIGAKDKIGYAMGDVASLLVFGLVQSVLQKYYTDVLGIGVVSIMLMFIVARVWDAINDPIWGRIVDSIPAAADGRYRRWMKTLAVPVALSAVLILYRYNSGALRLSVPVVMLMGLALFRLIFHTLLAPIMAYLAYFMAAGWLYLRRLTAWPFKALGRLCGRLIQGPVRKAYQKIVLRRARILSRALCEAQLAFAKNGFEGSLSDHRRVKNKEKKGSGRYGKKQDRGQNKPHAMGDPHSHSGHLRGRRGHRGAQFHGGQSVSPPH